MAYKLKKGIYKITCRYPNCSFDFEVKIAQNIMGMTQDDVETEAKKLARDIAKIKHDAIHGSNHKLTKPTIKKISGVFELIGRKKSSYVGQKEATKYKEYKKGDIILKKGDIATTICDVVKGSAYPDINKSHIYNVGDSFGVAALLVNQSRTANVIAAENGTTIGFYNLKELSKKDPRKAKELYFEAMEDIFNVLSEMGDLVESLENDLEKQKLIVGNKKERIEQLEADITEANARLAEYEGNTFS